ncbi:carboxyltransferase domain-containing protein [Galbitalea sp. SE-J8]|uniref:5-oxoprolinase subunit B family protein n=1 Tax=Galbitalea sp. SE-J8 TaxID=3054952 RepID=UPI00259C8463|nr:carboxyltransferase domain-containing protein [Galbitalea sp. SE-J8]MDM4763795.1 carboxyltransferase domain-containing protein [Galbitalea sp. SE-J8]
MRLLPSGEDAALAEYDGLAEAMGAYAALARTAPASVVDLVPAARTVLVRVRPGALAEVSRWVRATAPDAGAASVGASVTIAVRYDGPDLAAASAALSWSPAELVARHTGAAWTSAFIGFAPGFAYLVADGWPDAVPRHATSRASVPPGSVALAAGFTGVYPRASPGGWQLIGTTDAVLWDAARADPALLAPGTRVRFEAVP